MFVIFGLLMFAAFIMIIVSLIKPRWGTFGKRPDWTRKKAALTWVAVGVIACGLMTATTPDDVKQANQQKQQQLQEEKEAKEHIFGKYYGFSLDQSKAIEDALASVGLDKINDVTKKGDHDYVLDVHGKGGYSPQKDTIHLFLDENNKPQTIKYRAIALWQNGQAEHQISDYIISDGEMETIARMSKEAVKKVLKAPTSAKFDEGTFKFFKQKGVVTIIGTVDAQNSFGAMIRSPFKIQYQKDGNDWKPVHMTFESQELF